MKNTTSLRARALGWTGALAALGLYAVTHVAQAANPQLAGIWRIEKPVFAVRTVDGKTPPLKPAAAKLYAERQAARKAGDTSFDSATWCASVGMPRILFIDYPFEIVVREPYVAFLHEWNWWARLVYLDGALSNNAAAMGGFPGGPGGGPPGGGPGGGFPGGGPPGGGPGGGPPGGGPPGDGPGGGPPGAGPAGGPGGFSARGGGKENPGPMGLSKGRWEGNTLVIETSDVSYLTMLDSAGLPHSEALKLTERVSLRSPDVLEDRIRIEDPEVFTAPWETLVTYKRQRNAVINEDVCLDRIKNGTPAVKE